MNPLIRNIVIVLVAVCSAFLVGCGPRANSDVILPQGIPLPVLDDVPRHELEVRSIATSPAGDVLVTVSGDTAHLWRTADMAPLAVTDRIEQAEFARSVAISNGGKYLALLNTMGQMWLWDASTLKTRAIQTTWGQEPTRILGFDSKDWLYWLDVDRGLVGWNLQPGVEEASGFERLATVEYTRFSQQTGDQILLWGLDVVLLDTAGAELASRPLELGGGGPEPEMAPVVSATGEVGVVDERGRVWVIDPKTQNAVELQTQNVRVSQGPDDQISDVATDPGGRWLAVAWKSGGIEIWDLTERRLAGRINIEANLVRAVHPKQILDLEFGANQLFVLLPEQKLARYKSETWEPIEVHEL